MRIRAIKPDFFIDEDLAELDGDKKLFFIGLWCLADREGRLRFKPKEVEARLFPHKHQKPEIEAWATEMSPKFLTLYEIEGKQYLQINNFHRHQRPHWSEPPSEIPPPNSAGVTQGGGDINRGGYRKGKERKGKELICDEKSSPLSTNVDNPVDNPVDNSKGKRKPLKRQKAEKPRELWKPMIDHIWEYYKQKKGFSPPVTPKDRGILTRLYDGYGPTTIMACWDLWTESNQPWSDWAWKNGRSVSAFSNSLMSILDDRRWKAKAQKYDDKFSNKEGIEKMNSVLGDMMKGKTNEGKKK